MAYPQKWLTCWSKKLNSGYDGIIFAVGTVKVNSKPKLVVNWELTKKIAVNWYLAEKIIVNRELGTPISTLWELSFTSIFYVDPDGVGLLKIFFFAENVEEHWKF